MSPNSGFYTSKRKKSFLEMKIQLNKDWKIMVREVILDMYGSNIANYSATGKRTNRSAIDIHMLFKGLFDKYSHSHILFYCYIDLIITPDLFVAKSLSIYGEC